jgi:Asp-tRNA(Asn)/Glu-tRNA(Gln) amidotransferase A subunit family amidase
MCRSVEDCVLVFNAIYGPDGKDDSVADAPFAWNPDVPLGKLRIGFIKNEFDANAQAGGRGGGFGGGRGATLTEAQRQALQRNREARLKLLNDALDVYRKAGATLEPIDEVPGTALASDIGFVLSAEAAAAFDDLTRTPDGLEGKAVHQWANTFRSSRFVPAVEYIRAQRARTLLMREWHEFMSKYDAFLSPTQSSTLGVTNLTGHPAVALKCGFVDNAPVEVMVTGRLYDEATMLRVALAFERATPWHGMNPKLT